MPAQILMPALSPTMEEGKLVQWLVKEGDAVKPGQIVAEIETDKATMDLEAVDEGTLAKILVAAGTDKVKVNTPIAVVLVEGESAAVLDRMLPPEPIREPARASAPVSAAGAAVPRPPAAEKAEMPRAAPLAARAPEPNGHGVQRLFASPLARRLAKEAGLDLARLTGSGPRGRIVKRDIEAALAGGAARAAPAAATAVAPLPARAAPVAALSGDMVLALYEKGSYEFVPHDGMRRIIAQRLTQSKQTVPHFYLSLECRLDALQGARERINAGAPKDAPRAFRLSVNDFVIKAWALALQQVPAANATWTDGGMLRHKGSDVGVAVAVEGGLFTPLIRRAELKTLSEISNEMKDLAERARNRRLAPHEYQGGTTSISNLGMYGILSFDAIINPPHATILAVGAGVQQPVVAGNRIEIATVMNCTLSCDHRVVDGALGAQLLNAFKALIEDPVRMLL